MTTTESVPETESVEDDTDDTPASPSIVEGAITGVAGMVLGSAIIYFALPYCFNC